MNSDTFSINYIKQLVEHTNISDKVITDNEEEIRNKVNDVLEVASSLNKSGKISKKIIALILKEKGYRFI